MALIPSYTTGSATVTNGSNQVTFIGTALVSAAVRQGDLLVINGLSVTINEVVNNTTVNLLFPWTGTSGTYDDYEIRFTTDAARTLASTSSLLDSLTTNSLYALLGTTPATDTIPYYNGLNSATTTAFTAFARQMLAGADANAIQQLLGLVAQSSNIDSTAGRVLMMGAFGLGSTTMPTLDDINSYDIPAGFYTSNATVTAGTLPPNANIADTVIVLHPTASQTIQIYLGMTESGRNYIRKSNSNSSWGSWRSIMLDFEFGSGPGSGLDADTLDGYDSADFLKVSDYSSGGLLDMIKAVDGSGSGLDADLLDGYHESSFGRLSQARSWTAVQTFTSIPRLSVSGNTQLAVGYGVTGYNPTISFYSGTTTKSTLVDDLTNGFTVNSSLGGILQLGASGVAKLNTKQLATQEYVTTQINALVDSAPNALNTLNELATALGNDPNFATTVTNSIATKLDSSAYTAADVLAKLITVDGSGSGIDADKLDGYEASVFIRNNITSTQSVLGNFKVISSLFIDAPSESSNASLWLRDSSSTGRAAVYFDQINDQIGFRHINASSVSTYVRISDSIFSYNGNTVWHSGNDGAGSGLDADTLDSYHASSFILTTDTSVVKTTGDQSITGTKTFSTVVTTSGIGWRHLTNATTAGYAKSVFSYTDSSNWYLMLSDTATGTYNSLRPLVVNLSTGAVSISTALTASSISGSGSGLTNLNASNVSSGTLADARLSTNVCLLDDVQTISGIKTFSSQVKISSGTASAPGLAFSGDPDVGIYRPGTDQLGFSTGGVVSMVLDADANIRLYNTSGTYYTKFANQPTANRTLTIPDADVTLVSGTMVPTTVTLTAGAGLTGGGTLAANRTFAVGAGDGITVNAADVAVDSTVVRTTGNQSINGTKTFINTVTIQNGVELFANTPFIDFHYGNTSDDYNVRIINNISGRLTIYGKLYVSNGIDLVGNRITSVGTPAYSGDAVNKEYVDGLPRPHFIGGWKGGSSVTSTWNKGDNTVTITRMGEGVYRVIFGTALSDTNYVVSFVAEESADGNSAKGFTIYNKTTTGFYIDINYSTSGSNGGSDPASGGSFAIIY